MKCEHTSVGILVWKDNQLLLIERKNFPFGFAPPAGHLDSDTYEEAARRELQEEVGLTATKLKPLLEEKVNNKCRRENGGWHEWQIFEAETVGDLKPSQEETKKVGWYHRKELKTLANRTKDYRAGRINNESWERKPGLEEVWHDFLKKLGVI